MAPTQETHSGVAGVTPHGQPRTLHGAADAGRRATARKTTATPPGSRPVRSVTPGEAESSRRRAKPSRRRTDSTESRTRKRQPATQQPFRRANRVFVLDPDGKPLAPCTPRRARMLIDRKRVARRYYRPFTIQLKSRANDDPVQNNTEVRATPGRRTTGIAVVLKTAQEDRTVYQEEVQHRTDISRRLQERRNHRRRRRGEKWYRAPRFNNRRRAADRLPPSLKSVVSNQEHRIARLSERSGAGTTVVQDSKFDTQKILDPAIRGKEYQQGPLYQTHLRAYIRELWGHRCAYCGKAAWENRTRFELDHVVPRSKGGPTNIGNLVWACRPCNQAKADKDVDAFLSENPERSTAVLRRAHRRKPLAATGAMAWVCQTLVKRLKSRGLTIRTTTGADTAHARKQLGIPKTHADDAACCGNNRTVTQLREPARLKAVGHGRRKQIKGLPETAYLIWRLKPRGVRRRVPCPGHAHHPNSVHGVQTGEIVQVLSQKGWVRGRAQVEAARNRVTVKSRNRTASSSRASYVRRLAPRNGYTESS